MKNLNLFFVTVFLLSIGSIYSAAELAPEDIQSISFDELRERLPKGWETARGLLFVSNLLNSTVSVFSVAANGQLTPVEGSPFQTGTQPQQATVSPDGEHLFISNHQDNTVSVFNVAANGQLTPVEGSPFQTGTQPQQATVSPDGEHLFISNLLNSTVSVFNVAANGQLTPVEGSPFQTGTQPQQATVSPDGEHLFISNHQDNTVSVFNVAANGQLTPVEGSPFQTGTQPQQATVSPDGEHLFISNKVNNTVSVFNVAANGQLTPVEGSPFQTGRWPQRATVSPDGKKLFTSNYFHNVSVFSIAGDGQLTPVEGSPFQTGTRPQQATVSPDGEHLFISNHPLLISNHQDDTVSVFNVAANGQLTPVEGSPFQTGTRPQQATVSPDGEHLFISNHEDNTVSVFNVAANGQLTPVEGSPFQTGRWPQRASYGVLPKKWRDLQALDYIVPLRAIKYLTDIPEKTIAQMLVGENFKLTPALKKEIEEGDKLDQLRTADPRSISKEIEEGTKLDQLRTADPRSISFDYLQNLLFKHFIDVNRVPGGLFSNLASLFMKVKRGTLSPEGFRLLERWLISQDDHMLHASLRDTAEKLKKQDLKEEERNVLQAIKDKIQYELRTREKENEQL